MSDNIRCGARQSAHALLQCSGAAGIRLQMPALPVGDDDGEELGLRAPEFQWKRLSPAALRRRGTAAEAMVPADVLERELGVRGAGAVTAALLAATGVQAGDELFVLDRVEPVSACGSACLYRLLLLQPATEVV